jgi:hypothetical protein
MSRYLRSTQSDSGMSKDAGYPTGRVEYPQA